MTYGLATSDTLYLHVLHVFPRMVADFLSYAFVSYLKGFIMLETCDPTLQRHPCSPFLVGRNLDSVYHFWLCNLCDYRSDEPCLKKQKGISNTILYRELLGDWGGHCKPYLRTCWDHGLHCFGLSSLPVPIHRWVFSHRGFCALYHVETHWSQSKVR